MKTVYLIPLSHYDVAWAFNKKDYLDIYELTLEKALKMIEASDYKFVMEQTYPLEEFETKKPGLYERIKKAVEKGKIEIVDGFYLMPDLMIPGGETLVREILFGKHYCRKKFNIEIPIAWAADSFGLNAQMPQIYKKSGYNRIAFRRGLPRLIGRKTSEFIWEGLDGSKIIAHWMPLGYRAGLYFRKWEEHFKELASLSTTDCILAPCGSGGVPPQEDTPDAVREWNRKNKDFKIVIATPGEFFEAFASRKKRLTIFKGELYSADLEDIFPDVVSSRISLKRSIKAGENALLLAEKAASLAYMMGKNYPVDDMTGMWKKMLFLANHDLMPSCGIDEIYEDAWQYIDDINTRSNRIVHDSQHYLIEREEKADQPNIIVFNPYNWNVQDWVEADIKLNKDWQEPPGIAFQGKEIDSQVIEQEKRLDGSIKRVKVGFVADDVPSMGYCTYTLSQKKKRPRKGIAVKGKEVITPFFNITINDKNGLVKVYDKEGYQMLDGNELIIDEEVGDLYFHESPLDRCIASETGQGMRFGAFKPAGFEINKGPLKTRITLKTDFYCLRWPYYLTEKFGPQIYRHKTIEVRKHIDVFRDFPRIDFYTKINLKQSHVRIRLKFDTCMVAPSYARQTQFGVLELPHLKTVEQGMNVPSPLWVVSEEMGRGLAFMTKGIPINEIRAGEIYYTLLRSVSVLSADGISGPLIPTPEAMELGEHEYDYSIWFYEGNWKDNLIHQNAYEFGMPLQPFCIDYKPKEQDRQLFQLGPDNLVVTGMKRAEEDDALIVRFFETKGEECRAVLSMERQINKVQVVNLLEDEESSLEIKGKKLNMVVKPFEIVTLKLFLDKENR